MNRYGNKLGICCDLPVGTGCESVDFVDNSLFQGSGTETEQPRTPVIDGATGAVENSVDNDGFRHRIGIFRLHRYLLDLYLAVTSTEIGNSTS